MTVKQLIIYHLVSFGTEKYDKIKCGIKIMYILMANPEYLLFLLLRRNKNTRFLFFSLGLKTIYLDEN